MKCMKDLNPEQKQAAMHLDGPLLILAGAGSGKTKTLTYRIANLLNEAGIGPEQLLAVTFTNKAAKEMRQRVEQLIGTTTRGMWISTFHSACARILRENIEHLGYASNFNIIDAADTANLLKACMKDLNISDRLYSPREVAFRISALKNSITTPDEFAEVAQQFGIEIKIAKIYPLYQERLKASCVLDFDDLLMLTVQLLQGQKKVLAHYQDTFRHIMVDEYQDTNSAQYKLIRLLVGKNRNICVVGDDDQSIYGWRGADMKNILDFEKDFPDTKVIKLERNYRSTQRILDAAWSVVCNNPGRRPKKLWTDIGMGEKTEYLRLPTEEAEAQHIAREITKGVKDGKPCSDYAILYRTNTQSRTIEEALRREGLPYIIVGGTRFYDRKEVKDLITYLKVLSNNKDSVSLKRIVNTPPRGIGEAAMKKAADIAGPDNLPLLECLARLSEDPSMAAGPRRRISEFLALLDGLMELKDSLAPSKLAEKLLIEIKYREYLKESLGVEAQAKIDNIKELVSSIKEFEKTSENPTLEEYLAQASLLTDWDTKKTGEPSVTLMTLHLSKGLEFPVVFITGLEEGLIPHAQSKCDIKELEEERRLLYVGMTRAKKKLYLCNAITRRLAGLTQQNKESRFIEEIPAELLNCKKTGTGKGFVAYAPHARTNTIIIAAATASVEKQVTSMCIFKTGERVHHQLWGYGTVEKTDGRGDDQKVTVLFKTVGKKKLLTKMANLSRTS